jgi:ascorbate-specific PTS system EIIC-type component UlaA
MTAINKKTILGYLLVVSCSLLLVLSPCPVRNSIQNIMEVETTQSFNKSKAIISSCSSELTDLNEVSALIQNSQKVNHSQVSVWVFLLLLGLTPFTTKLKKSSLHLIPIDKEVKIPFYILYKRLKYQLH